MIRIRQTIFGNFKGNCFSACIASLLEIPLENVPNFCVLGNYESLYESEWFDSFLFWLSDLNMSYVELDANYTKMANGQLCILTGKSPRGDFRHCIIGKFEDEKILEYFDPHPSDDGLDGYIEQFGIFIPTDPNKHIHKGDV